MGRTTKLKTESRTHNSTYTQGGVSCSVDSFVGIESSVLRINFSCNLPALRVAAKRWLQPFGDSANIKLTARNERQKYFRQSRVCNSSQKQKRSNATHKPTQVASHFDLS